MMPLFTLAGMSLAFSPTQVAPISRSQLAVRLAPCHDEDLAPPMQGDLQDDVALEPKPYIASRPPGGTFYSFKRPIANNSRAQER